MGAARSRTHIGCRGLAGAAHRGSGRVASRQSRPWPGDRGRRHHAHIPAWFCAGPSHPSRVRIPQPCGWCSQAKGGVWVVVSLELPV